MATALKLKKDITKLKAAISSKATPKSFIPKLKSQLEKAEAEYSAVKLGKKTKKTTTKATATSLSKLQDLIKKKKYGTYKGAGVDLEKDADRPALPTGKRISKNGNRYYEYRANRIDVKQPPKKYPKLEKGGYMAKGGGIRNQYDGMTAKEVWESWTFEQKKHFLLDHKDHRYSPVGLDKKERIEVAQEYSWEDLPANIKLSISDHLEDGEYKYGGYMAKGGESSLYYINLDAANMNSSFKNWLSSNDISYKVIEEKGPAGENPFVKFIGSKSSLKKLIDKEYIKGMGYNENEIQEFYNDIKKYNGKLEDGGYMAKGGEVKVGDTLTATTGVKVKVVEFDPAFGGRVKVERLDEYATGKPSQWMPLKKFKFASGGYMADGGELHRTEEKYAMGGALEHGLKEGDHIMVVKGNILGIKNEETGEFATLDISTGERNDAPHLKESLGLMKYYSRNKE